MKKDAQESIADLGALGIIREAFRLFRAHVKHFLLIQLTLILPVAFLVFAAVYFLLGFVIRHILLMYLSRHMPQAHPPPGNAKSNLSSFDDAYFVMETFTLVTAISFFGLVARALSDSATLYSVGLIYTWKRVAFVHVVRSVIPHLWLRLTITRLYVGVLDYVLMVIMVMTSMLIIVRFRAHMWTANLLNAALCLLVIPVFFYLNLIVRVASGVSILEERYGLAAIKKAIQLLQGKRWVAVLFQVLWVLSTIILTLMERPILRPEGITADRIWTSLLLLVGSMVYTTFLSQMGALCAGVQYASFKAYHNESISDFSVDVKQNTHEARKYIAVLGIDENDQKDDAFDNAKVQKKHPDESLV